MWLLATIASPWNKKIKATLEGKRHIWENLQKNLKNRDASKELIWIHAPSAGEFLQGQPLLEKLLDNGFDCVLTFNSISAQKWIDRSSIVAKKQPLFADYLPFDYTPSIRKWMNIVKPSALIFVRYDLWPNLIWQADKAGIPIYLISAALHTKTRRYTSRLGRSFYKDLYSRMRAIFVVEETDRDRFHESGSNLGRVEVLGDTRFDSVLQQRDRRELPELPFWLNERRVFIVGSNWPPDEACVFPGLKRALARYDDFVLITAPHEPTEEHIQSSETFFRDYDTVRLSKVNSETSDDVRIIVVDYVGILAALYRVGYMAYVGGGFTTGVHNVIEPCALGLPVFFGPRHVNSPEAVHLKENGLAFPIEDPETFETLLFDLLNDPQKTTLLGRKARNYVESKAGASEKCFQYIVNDLKQIRSQSSANKEK